MSLSSRLLLVTNALILVGMVSMTIFLSSKVRASEEADLEARMQVSAQLISGSVSTFIWNFDKKSLADLADKVSKLGDIQGAEFTDKKGEVLAKAERSADAMQMIKLDIKSPNGEEVVGSINLKYNDSSVQALVQSLIMTIAMGALVFQAFVSLALWYYIRRTAKKITEAVGSLQDAASQTFEAGRNFSKMSETLAEQGIVQSSAIEETNATLTEIGAMVGETEKKARQAEGETGRTLDVAQAGMQRIENLKNRIDDVVKATGKIVEVTAAVDDIAFQINLLALNASVEAARAGDQGRGFAVVADAVRMLAGRSATAAKDIGGIVSSSQEQIQSVQKSAEENVKALNEILGSITKVRDLNVDISKTSTEQFQGVNSISKAMIEIDSKSAQAAHSASTTSSSAQQLLAQTELLREAIGVINFEINGSSTAGKMAEVHHLDTTQRKRHAA